MQYNLDLRDKAIFDSAELTYQTRKTIESSYRVVESAIKTVFSWFSFRNMVLFSIGIMAIELLVIAVLMVVAYA